MKIMGKTVIAAALLITLISAGAWAQSAYPNRHVTILLGYPAGTPNDTVARVVAAKLSDRIGQPVIVENKPGAATSLAAAAVLKAAPDGYTLYLSGIANTINPSVNKMTFDFIKDFAPITMVDEVPVVLVVPASGPSTLKELIAQAKQNPGKVSFGSSGAGTATHLFGELFARETGTKLTHVPYRGSSQAVVDLLASRIQVMFSPAGTALPHIKAGKLKALATSAKHRLEALPDVPTFGEAGIQKLDFSLWVGLSAPAGTPAPVVAYLNKEVGAVLALPDVKAKLLPQLIYPTPSTSEAFGAFVRQDTERWAEVVKAAGIKANN
ncbi:MAG TPA: tripartite tricarboxylate transporter substrate binding protein [Pseudolabrys sp.]|nr:tripartite tricarboxylate transporter substrate binding protein [Pseudolabrys sp.]